VLLICLCFLCVLAQRDDLSKQEGRGQACVDSPRGAFSFPDVPDGSHVGFCRFDCSACGVRKGSSVELMKKEREGVWVFFLVLGGCVLRSADAGHRGRFASLLPRGELARRLLLRIWHYIAPGAEPSLALGRFSLTRSVISLLPARKDEGLRR
jgi:hypothetical protein